ncbi:MAG: hypothetical protein R2771_11700 [Saprospiraceae bacterium]
MHINDGTIAIFILGFIIRYPFNEKAEEKFIMDWKAAEDILWEIIFTFQLVALANGFKDQDYHHGLKAQLSWLKEHTSLYNHYMYIIDYCFSGELTSNTTAVETFHDISESIHYT